MPTWLVDIGLSTSITLSVLILMVAIWIEKPLDFSSFPTVLLVATLLRLALNLATVRLILAGGHKGLGAAGSVIKGFAAFVVGGDFVIGVVLFAILVVINFMVITKVPAASPKWPHASRSMPCRASRWQSTPISPQE